MKIATMIATYLLGLVFTVFGLNGFLHFIPMPPMEGDTATFANIFLSTGYMTFVKFIEVVCGIMLLVGFKRPLALLLITPIVIGILLFELLVAKQPGIGIALTAMTAFLFYVHRDRFMPILA